MASATSGIESFLAGSAYDPATAAAAANSNDKNQTIIVAGIAAFVLVLLAVLKK